MWWWCIFIHLTTRPSTDGKRAPLTAISLQAVGSPKETPQTYIAKMWLLKKLGKNVFFSQNHTETNSDDWTITKKTTRTTKHENFAKMKIWKLIAELYHISFWLTVVYIVYSLHCLCDSTLSLFCTFPSFVVLIFLCVKYHRLNG